MAPPQNLDEPGRDRILHWLKSRGPQTAAVLGERLGMTAVGARKHLASLQSAGLVRFEDRAESVGRPKRYFFLTESAHSRFPDAHSMLNLELIQSVRELFGETGLEQLIAVRERATLAQYREAIGSRRSLAARVKALSRIRAQEGYMAECQRAGDGAWLLVENHCPICAAATACQGFCRSELEVFESVLGEDVEVTRVDHLLAGARRCAYRVAPREKRRSA